MATPSAARLNAQFAERKIPLELIDEPARPERETMEEADLAELAINIKEVGLIKPLIVKPVGDRYECVAGHRRLLAMRIVQYSPVPCRVVVKGYVDPLALLVSENAHTEAVNPVEEARFYARLLDERCGNDVDALCIAVGRRREYVEDRLLILRGDPHITDALQKKSISFAVARELNKVQDPGRRLLLLDVSINQGASARQVAQWRRDADLQGPVFGPNDGSNGSADTSASTVQPYQMRCLFCEGTEDPHMMELVYLHKPCGNILLRILQRASQPAPE
jgi:ParB family chromosome partitioning protein